MPLLKTFAAICVGVALGLMGPQPARAKDLIETAQDAGTFTVLLAAVKATGLTPLLTGKGPITLFAPTDDAFSKLPKATLEGLFKPDNKEKLKEILAYHVVLGKVTSRDVLGKRLEAANAIGGTLLIDGNRGITVDEARVIKADIVADNGFIHVIDTVVIPK